MTIPPSPYGLRRIGSLPDHAGGAQALAWSPTAPTLAAADMRSVHLWDMQSGNKINDLFGPSESTTALCWSPDGKLLAAAAGSLIWLWGRGIERIPTTTTRITCMDWSADGRFIAWAGSDADDLTIHLYDVTVGSEITQLKGIEAPITALAWSPDCQLLAATAHDGLVRCWTAQSDQPIMRLQGHEDTSWCLSWASNSRMLASGGLDGRVCVWDLGARAELRNLRGHQSWIYAIAWAPQQNLIVSGSGDPEGADRSIRLWDPVQGTEVGRADLAHNDIIHAIAWAPDGARFASASGDERVTLWEVMG